MNTTNINKGRFLEFIGPCPVHHKTVAIYEKPEGYILIVPEMVGGKSIGISRMMFLNMSDFKEWKERLSVGITDPKGPEITKRALTRLCA